MAAGLDNSARFNSDRSMSANSFSGRDVTDRHGFGHFGQARNSVRTTETPRVNRESIAQPLSHSLRMSRSEQIAEPLSSAVRSNSAGGFSGRHDARMGAVASTGRHGQSTSVTNNRRSVMEPLNATTRHRFSGHQGFVGGNRSSSRSINTSGVFNTSSMHQGNWSHNSWSQGNWSHNNWSHNNWMWNRNFHHGDFHHNDFFHHHHRDFDNDFVFIGFGGFWPWWGSWWWWGGWYPYYWYPWWYGPSYGYYPYNYGSYNYNYYGSDYGSTDYGMQVPDYNALSAVGQKMKAQPQTQSDKLFDEGVEAFGHQDYATAVEKFRMAVRLEPNDTVLPFAYAQALFANNDYEKAAAVITTTLYEMAPEKPEVFYPGGLYKDENILNAQIENLHRAVLMDPQNSQLQLLYGYQLLGVGKTDEAMVPLNTAKRDARTAPSATLLLDLLKRTEQPSTAPD
jgi:Flp pilus assembly protein TadD